MRGWLTKGAGDYYSWVVIARGCEWQLVASTMVVGSFDIKLMERKDEKEGRMGDLKGKRF